MDENNEKVLAFKRKYGLDGKFVIMYSGNIGLYYDLENLIQVLIYSLNAGDVHWCVNAKGIKGVSCPSNVYLKLSVAA